MCFFPMMELRCIFKGVNRSAGSQLSASQGRFGDQPLLLRLQQAIFTHKDALSYHSSVFIVKVKASVERGNENYR